MLFSRYASPMELMSLYIENGRFEEFVENIISMDRKRKQEEAEKENEQKLWDMYLRSTSDKSFIEWKKEVFSKNQDATTLEMTDEQVKDVKDKARGILKGFSPQ